MYIRYRETTEPWKPDSTRLKKIQVIATFYLKKNKTHINSEFWLALLQFRFSFFLWFLSFHSVEFFFCNCKFISQFWLFSSQLNSITWLIFFFFSQNLHFTVLTETQNWKLTQLWDKIAVIFLPFFIILWETNFYSQCNVSMCCAPAQNHWVLHWDETVHAAQAFPLQIIISITSTWCLSTYIEIYFHANT